MTLKQKTFSAVRWTSISALARALLHLAQIAILARLLAPADYGLMAIAGVVLGFMGLFADLGLNSAYIQRQNVTENERSSLFWLNLGVSGLLALLIIALSPLIALFYGNERLLPILMLCATVLVFNAFGQQIRMTAEKDLNFKTVVLIEVSSLVIGFLAAVSGAIRGAGVYALVLGSIVSSAAGSLLAWGFISNGWRPQRRFSLADIRPYIRFGGAMVGNNVINYINTCVDLMLGGRLLGAGTLGLYSVPRNMILQTQFLVNPIITRIGFPLIAQIQEDVHRVKAVYLKTMKMTASCNAPIYIGLAVYAPEIVYMLLGPNWASSIDLMRILSVWGLLRSMGNPVGSLLFGMGRAGLAFKWNLCLLLVTPLVIWIGSIYGPTGMALAMSAYALSLLVPSWYFLVRPLCGLSFLEYATAVIKPVLIASLAIVVSLIISQLFNYPAMRLLIGIVISFPLYIVGSYVFNHELYDSITHLILLRDSRVRV